MFKTRARNRTTLRVKNVTFRVPVHTQGRVSVAEQTISIAGSVERLCARYRSASRFRLISSVYTWT